MAKIKKKGSSIHRFKQIFDDSPVGIIEMDYSALANFGKKLFGKKSAIREYIIQNPSKVKAVFSKVKIIEANKAAYALYGAKNKKQLLENFGKVLTTSALDVLSEQFISLLTGECDFKGEFKYRTPKRIFQDVFLSVSVPQENRKNFSRVVLTLQDITTWKRVERQLRKKARLDGLTKLLNQSAITERLEEELIRAKRYGLNLSCMMIDLDFFKVINDKFGHQRGDKILQRVAKMIRGCFRKVDIVGRYGGDEFFVILPETKDRLAKFAAMRLQKIFANTMFKYKRIISFNITLSIGIAGYPSKKIKDAKDFIAWADKAMYQCKMDGRDRIEIAKT